MKSTNSFELYGGARCFHCTQQLNSKSEHDPHHAMQHSHCAGVHPIPNGVAAWANPVRKPHEGEWE
jgi:hypothetical protein